MMNNQKRRLFLRALVACVGAKSGGLLAAVLAQPSAAELDQFLKAASALTGIKLTDRELALTYFDILRTGFGATGIKELSAAAAQISGNNTKLPLAAIVQQAILLWLTGVSSDAATGAQEVVAYTEAAVWQALPFTKPPGQCGGAFGYWSDAPAIS